MSFVAVVAEHPNNHLDVQATCSSDIHCGYQIQSRRSLPNQPLFGSTGGPGLHWDGGGSHDLGEPRAISTPRFKSTLSLLKLMLRAFGDVVTTPGAVIEVLSPDPVEPFKDYGSEAAAALPAAAKNRTNSPTANIFPVFVISQIPPEVIKLLPLRIMIMIVVYASRVFSDKCQI